MPDIETAHPEQRPRDLAQRHLTYRVVAMPADTNGAGDIFGGWLMAQVDLAGSILAFQAAAGRIATVAVNEFRFLRPVLVGDLVSCYARLRYLGKTSVQIGVEVEVERMREPGVSRHVAEATLTYVALTPEGRPRRIPRAGQETGGSSA